MLSALRATQPGFYPVMTKGADDPTALTWLEQGDVWKFGKTVDASGRYTDSYLDSIGPGVRLETEFEGTVDEAHKVEQMKIDNYVMDPSGSGELPPGNKVRR